MPIVQELVEYSAVASIGDQEVQYVRVLLDQNVRPECLAAVNAGTVSRTARNIGCRRLVCSPFVQKIKSSDTAEW